MTEVYYDPYDFEIDADPYPIWARLREERPLYHNERYNFFALSRFDDVEKGLVDWRGYSSAKGTLLELIKSGMEIPPGSIIFEDPPNHDLHRGLLSRVFTPRKMNAIEPGVCPGTATGVTVRSPSVIFCPSTISASCFGMTAGGPAGPRPPRAGGGFSITIQSAADT